MGQKGIRARCRTIKNNVPKLPKWCSVYAVEIRVGRSKISGSDVKVLKHDMNISTNSVVLYHSHRRTAIICTTTLYEC